VTAQAAKAQEHWDRLLRVMADFDNYKKRAARERMDAVKFANEALLQKLVPVLDSFDAALAATTSANHGSVQQLQAGFAMIYQQLKSALAEAGLEEVNAHQQPFNPRLHEAVGQQESADVAEGQVLQQVRRGYQFKERLLRPASVVVAKKTTGK
jgi:molecular chaperone GrpE